MVRSFDKILEGASRLASLSDVDEVVKNLSGLLKKTVKSRWVVVYLFDRERRDFAPARSHGLPPRYQNLFRDLPLYPDKIPLVKSILRKKHHLLITDAGHSEMLTPLFRKLLRRLTLLAVPMVVRNQVMGAVFVARSSNYPPFNAEEIAMIRDLVSHAALVVSHMRLFDDSLDMAIDMAKGIDIILTLDEINKAISSSLSREKILETAMQNIERIIQCELVVVLEEVKGELVVMASHANGPVIPPEFLPGTSPVTGPCAVWEAFSKGERCYIPLLAQMKRPGPLDKLLSEAGIKSLLAIPLVSKDKVKGVLMLGDTEAGQFGKEVAFTIEKIASQMAVALENAKLYEDMRSLFINTVASLANAIDAKSPWTKGHSERVMHIAADIAREMGLSDQVVERVRLGGLLHDIGKIGVIEALLEKPITLSEDEFPPLRLHPAKGVAILAPIEQLKEVLPAILHHHERYDGTGYPAGMKGEEIPLEARIVTVADAFDAMVSERPYKKGFSVADALEELTLKAGSQFDPQVVDCFVNYVKRNMRL